MIKIEKNPKAGADFRVGKKKKSIEIKDAIHSILGPSASERWLECLGSVLATKGLPDTSSPYAIQGTAAHTVSEWCRQQNVKAVKFLGTTIIVKTSNGPIEVLCDQEMVDGVQAFVDFVNDIPGEPFFEEMVSYDAWVPDGFGTSDDARIQDGLCTITDLKYGEGIQVYAKDNTQLMLYALGFFQKYGHLYEIEEFELIVFQPRLDHIDRWMISLVDLLQWAQDVAQPRAEAALKPGAPFKPGSWCQFCKIKNRCKARAEWALTQVAGEEDVFENLDEVVEEVRALKDKEFAEGVVSLLSNDDIARLLPAAAGVRSFFTAIEALAMSEIQQGHAVGDYKLVEGRSKRRWNAAEEAIVDALKGARMRMAQIFKKKLISPPQAEKILGKRHQVLAEFAMKPTGKPVLVPGSDPRETLSVDAMSEFDNLDDDVEDDEDD